jgi:hypothetical protein
MLTAQFFANIACLIAVAAAIAVCIECECNRRQWSERRD